MHLLDKTEWITDVQLSWVNRHLFLGHLVLGEDSSYLINGCLLALSSHGRENTRKKQRKCSDTSPHTDINPAMSGTHPSDLTNLKPRRRSDWRLGPQHVNVRVGVGHSSVYSLTCDSLNSTQRRLLPWTVYAAKQPEVCPDKEIRGNCFRVKSQ